MKELNLKAKVTNKRYNSYKGQIGKICSNHLMVKTIKNEGITPHFCNIISRGEL